MSQFYPKMTIIKIFANITFEIIQFLGAIPSLEETINGRTELPSFPAAIVLQGTAMLASDPIRCQTGPGKVRFL